jgi:hypothetical protein
MFGAHFVLRPGISPAPVLALLRRLRAIRPRPGRPAHAGVAEVQQGGKEQRGGRNLARDLHRRRGNYEAIYANMPEFGGRETARRRLQ